MRTGDGFTASSEVLGEAADLIVDMPPLLLVRWRLVRGRRPSQIHKPCCLHHDPWRHDPKCRPTDTVALMARLWLLSLVMKQPTVRLSELLGGIEV